MVCSTIFNRGAWVADVVILGGFVDAKKIGHTELGCHGQHLPVLIGFTPGLKPVWGPDAANAMHQGAANCTDAQGLASSRRVAFAAAFQARLFGLALQPPLPRAISRLGSFRTLGFSGQVQSEYKP